jgi:hypothetical protein
MPSKFYGIDSIYFYYIMGLIEETYYDPNLSTFLPCFGKSTEAIVFFPSSEWVMPYIKVFKLDVVDHNLQVMLGTACELPFFHYTRFGWRE